MKIGIRFLAIALCVAWPVQAVAEWQAVEKIKTYAVTGQSGPELYASIGAKGPKAGTGRAIAHTNFKLTWTRKYQQQGDACTLVSAVPKLIITYTVPDAAGRLPDKVARDWKVFVEGVRKHERAHGDLIKQMVRDIESASVGRSVAGDPGCKKIRAQLQSRLAEISLDQRRKSREFDRIELGDGGNVHQLILELVNGG